jgi:hypothetical protein
MLNLKIYYLLIIAREKKLKPHLSFEFEILNQ